MTEKAKLLLESAESHLDNVQDQIVCGKDAEKVALLTGILEALLAIGHLLDEEEEEEESPAEPPDRKKAKLGLECCLESDRTGFCPERCPYGGENCHTRLMMDVETLMEEE